MIWVYRNIPQGFEDLSLYEMEFAGLTQVSTRFFCADNFDLAQSAYGAFKVEEVSRGFSPKEAIEAFNSKIPSPYRVEKFSNKRRRGSKSFANIFEEIHGGVIRASDPASIILVFTPDDKNWIAGFLIEKKDSILDEMTNITERTSVSLTSAAALALVNISGNDPVVDPCCGTGLIPLASMLIGKKTYMADNNYNMLNKSRINRDLLNLNIDISKKDAFNPWVKNCCLVSDFPADRSWDTNIIDLSLKIFTTWIPFIKSFCVIFPNRIIQKLPNNIQITKKIKFSAGRTIVLGVTKK